MSSFLVMLWDVLKVKFSVTFVDMFETGLAIGVLAGAIFGVMLGLKLELNVALALGLAVGLLAFVLEKTVDSRLGLLFGFIPTFSILVYFGHLLATYTLTWLLVGATAFFALVILSEWIFVDLMSKGVIKN